MLLNNKLKDIWLSSSVFILVFILNFIGFYSQPFYRDFSVIYEGGYRIILGQVPYRDFYIPMGPVILYMQAIFNLLFGSTALAMAIHASVLVGILALVVYRLLRLDLNRPISVFLAICMLFSFIGLINYPWYNQTAYFFFLLAIIILIKNRNKEYVSSYELIGMSVLTMFAFYSKQDLLLMFPLIFFYYLYFFRSEYKRVLIFYFLTTISLCLLVAIGFSLFGDFGFWFNYGQIPHENRFMSRFFALKTVINNFSYWQTYLLLVCLYLLMFKKHPNIINRSYFILIMLTIAPLIISATSGQWQQTLLQGVPLVFFLIYNIVNNLFSLKSLYKYKLLMNFLIVAFTIVTLKPFYTAASYIGKNIAASERLQKVSKIKSIFIRSPHFQPFTKMKRIKEGAYSGVLMGEKPYEDLIKIKNIINENNNNFFNMTEYTFLYSDFDVIPPVNYPLYFRNGMSFFDDQISLITDKLLEKQPKIILLQDAHGHFDANLHNDLMSFYSNHGYRLIDSLESAKYYSRKYYSEKYYPKESDKIHVFKLKQ